MSKIVRKGQRRAMEQKHRKIFENGKTCSVAMIRPQKLQKKKGKDKATGRHEIKFNRENRGSKLNTHIRNSIFNFSNGLSFLKCF